VSVSLYATNTGLKVEASIYTENVSGIGAAVNPRLHCQVKLNISEETSWNYRGDVQSWSFGQLSGEFLIGTEKLADIRSYTLDSTKLGGQDYSPDIILTIEVPLDARRIEWIERQRSGKSFEGKFNIKLQVQIFGKNPHTANFPFGLIGNLNIYGDIPLIVPDTQWREKVLPGLGYGKVMVIELPAVSLESCAALDHSFKALENAQRQFALGLYDETAGSCRVALDKFFEPTDKGDGSGKLVPKLKKSWETQLGAATHRWLDDALRAIKDVTNKPHHSPHNHFDRLEMLMMITTALVSYAAQKLSDESEI
jgi:hypothetical protein